MSITTRGKPVPMHKLRFVSSVAILMHVRGKPARVSVPALPWRGEWAVTKVSDYSITVTHVRSGQKIADVRNLRVGRVICAVMNALPYDWTDYAKVAHEFRETAWFEWLKGMRA